MDKLLAELMREKKKIEETQITKTMNESGNLTLNFTVTK